MKTCASVHWPMLWCERLCQGLEGVGQTKLPATPEPNQEKIGASSQFHSAAEISKHFVLSVLEIQINNDDHKTSSILHWIHMWFYSNRI